MTKIKKTVKRIDTSKAEQAGLVAGQAAGAVVLGSLGLLMCFAAPVIPWFVGTMQITALGAGVGATGITAAVDHVKHSQKS
jgi:hypothetical protein